MTIVVQVEAADSPVAAALIQALSWEMGALYGDDGTGNFSPSDVAVPRATFLVAYLDGIPAGCGALRPMEGGEVAEIKRMYTDPSMRRRGVSSAILRELEEAAHHFEYLSIILETGRAQPDAIALYRRFGYQEIDCYGEYAGDPDSICFEKVLRNA
jgi:putative acetyltransferase